MAWSSPRFGQAVKEHATQTHNWPKTPRDVCSRSTLEKVSKPERGFTHPAQSWLSSRPKTYWESCTELPRLLAAEIPQMQCLENYCLLQYASTILVHSLSFSTPRSRFKNVPAASNASFFTPPVQSERGLPTLRTYLSVAGCRVPGQNVTSRIGSASGFRAILPKSKGCGRCKPRVKGLSLVVCRTRAFDTRDT